MTTPVWETNYNLGTAYVGIPVNIQLIAQPVAPAISVTYSLVGGSLPTGLSLLGTGYLRGTFTQTNLNTVINTNLIVRATDNLGNSITKTFLLTLSYVKGQPIWNTNAGTLGVYPALVPIELQLSATPLLPAVSVTYTLISGSLPNGLELTVDGLLYGIPQTVSQDTISNFVIRATDNYSGIRDRTFSMTITGTAIPEFTTSPGTLFTTLDSLWIEYQIQYTNPIPNNLISIRILQGELPTGLEINEYGLIRGYPAPPTIQLNLPEVITSVTEVNNNIFSSLTTSGFRVNRPIIFSGTEFGGVVLGQTYYIKQVLNATQFSISETVDGTIFECSDEIGFMDITLPTVSVGQPTKKTYSFRLILESPFGNDIANYDIIVTNQNMPTSQGGPGYPLNSRVPTIYNTRPPVYDVNALSNFGYYLLPADTNGTTYSPTELAYIGQLESDNYFSFKILGHDFDDSALAYYYVDLPLGIVGDSVTGWITGTPVIADSSISQFSFQAYVSKASNPSLTSPTITFSFKVANQLSDLVIWLTNSDLGTLLNGSTSSLKIEAESDVQLTYRLLSGNLPPNLNLLSNGEITGKTAWQFGTNFLNPGSTLSYNFTVEAFSQLYPSIKSSKSFTVTLVNEFTTPTDILYIKATPSLENRNLLRTLLENNDLIPSDYLYRPTDPSFGKASSVIYAHAYGINSSSFDEYVAAVTKNHYWRSLVLGSLSTAIAKDNQGNIVYEVVYSNVIDNLINPQGQSVSEEIFWPRPIDLFQGPWYTSITNIYTSYEFNKDSTSITTELNNPILTENGLTISTEEGIPTYYTSLTPGYARLLYPNSLPNMRNRVGQVLGVQADYRLLPLWMTSQQPSGNTLGFVPAWVICYTKPGYSEIIKNNIQNNWKDPTGRVISLNQINFQIDRFTVDKSATYNYDNTASPSAWLTYPSGQPVPDPTDSKDFYVLFPRRTILPDNPQYS